MDIETSAIATDLCSLAVRSLVLYSLAEFQGGHASRILVNLSDSEFSVSDDGRGHAIQRAIAGKPYLPFIYTHFDYPFGEDPPGAVQLQGIGISLVNALCSELAVEVKKHDGTLRLRFQAGKLVFEERDETANNATGTKVRGRIRADLQRGTTDLPQLCDWLSRLVAAHPALILQFNGAALAKV